MSRSVSSEIASALREAEFKSAGVTKAESYVVITDLASAADNSDDQAMLVMQADRVAKMLRRLTVNHGHNTCLIVGPRNMLPQTLLAANIREAKEENPEVAQAVTPSNMQVLLTFYKLFLLHGVDSAVSLLQNSMCYVAMVVTPTRRLFMSLEEAGDGMLTARQL